MSFLSDRSIQEALPAGVIFPYAGSTAPDGWLLCNGSAISRTTYARLFAAIGTTYGSGDGSTTFSVPNAQGVFLRGAGSQTISSITYTGTRGTTQNDQMQGHRHNTTIPYATGNAATPNTFAGNSGSTSNFNSAGPISDGVNDTPRTGSQTHPANISVNYIIKI